MTRLLAIALLFAGTLQRSAASTQTFSVLVLDALSGEPQANVVVDYFCEGRGFAPQNKVTTGKNGLAVVPFLCDGEAKIELSLIASTNKEECGGLAPLSFAEILTQGAISKPDGAGNIWCPTKVSKKMQRVPGQVIMFIKKPTWWQSHVAG
jgi:hypothetical protein